MFKKPFRKPLLVSTCLIIAFVILAVGGFLFHVDQALGFPMFAPGPLPEGIAVASHEVSIYAGEGSTFKRLNYSTNSSNFTIWEVKISPEDAKNTSTCTMVPVNDSCDTYTTPKHQVYVIQATYTDSDKNNPTEQIVSWLRGSTFISIELRDDQAQKYPTSIWPTIVDGFAPADYSHDLVKFDFWHGI